jgi:hypothetical protein
MVPLTVAEVEIHAFLDLWNLDSYIHALAPLARLPVVLEYEQMQKLL